MPEPNPDDRILDNVVEIDDSETSKGESKPMDIDATTFEETTEEDMRSFSALVQEALASAEMSDGIVRTSAAQRFAQTDILEAAAAEMIMQLNS